MSGLTAELFGNLLLLVMNMRCFVLHWALSEPVNLEKKFGYSNRSMAFNLVDDLSILAISLEREFSVVPINQGWDSFIHSHDRPDCARMHVSMYMGCNVEI